MNDDIFFKPRSGEEVTRATRDEAPIVMYSTLCEAARRTSIEDVFEKMFSISRKYLILLQDPANMNSGHWLGLVYVPDARKNVYFFSSYGGKPDVEKLRWIQRPDLKKSRQDINFFNNGLKHLCKRGWVIHYNDHPYQFDGDNTATCGIWTAAFLNSNMNPEQFYRYNLRRHMGAREYYFKYFRKHD